MTKGTSIIQVSSVGLENKKVYIAHEKGSWGPEFVNSDYKQHHMSLSTNGPYLVCDGVFLENGEEFKIVVPVVNEEEARKVYNERISKGVHVNERFDFDDFDSEQNIFWLLAESHLVIRGEEWSQNNVY